MLVLFSETRRLSEDGFAVKVYEKGHAYDLADNAARRAINKGWASKVDDDSLLAMSWRLAQMSLDDTQINHNVD